MNRIRVTWLAIEALAMQFLLLADQACNAVILGLAAVVMAAATGEEQAVAYADETLSAHAHRAGNARKRWSLVFQPLVDRMFFWQGRDPLVDAGAGRPIANHCERAFWKKRLRLGLPKEYQ